MRDCYWNCTVLLPSSIFYTIWAKLAVVFTRTCLPLDLYTSVFGYGCGFGFEHKFWQIVEFGETKRSESADLHTPINPLP